MKGIPLLVAFRFLGGKKSHSAVNATAIVSVVGVAVATAAVVCVLSVFNGFQSILAERMDTLSPDLMVTPAAGKSIANGDSLAEVIKAIEGVEIATPTLTDNALGYYDGRETPVVLKGVVPEEYAKATKIDSLLFAGGVPMWKSEADNPALISIGVAYKLNIMATDKVFTIFAPKRLGRYNPANPAAAFVMDSLCVADVFQSLQEDYDENTVFADISTVRDLLLYDLESTAVEVKVKEGADHDVVAGRVRNQIGKSYSVKDRLQQQQINFRMIQIEKWMTFLLLFFILVIASFNIITTLSMLVLEKTESMQTLSAIGMSKRSIASVFMWESVLVSAIGSVAGLAIGAILCMLQHKYGFITIANSTEMLSEPMPYPVLLEYTDLLITLLPILLITIVCAFVATSFARSRLGKSVDPIS